MTTLILQIEKEDEIRQLRDLLKQFDHATLFVEHALKPEKFGKSSEEGLLEKR